MDDDIRLPLDMLLLNDVDSLEDALSSKYALEFECEIYFCRTKKQIKELLLEFGEDVKWYEIDDIENDRIRAAIDLLNMAEENQYISHIVDRLVK